MFNKKFFAPNDLIVQIQTGLLELSSSLTQLFQFSGINMFMKC